MHVPQDNVQSPLYVITAIFDPQRYKRRWELYRSFQSKMRQAGAILITVEAAFGERSYALEQHAPSGPLLHSGAYKSYGPAPTPPGPLIPHSRVSQDYIKVRVGQMQEIWLKENLLNIGLRHLPEDAKYVAFIDADTDFVRPDWISETLHQLQHYDTVQMFSVATNVGPKYQPLENNLGFAYCHAERFPYGSKKSGHGEYYRVPASKVPKGQAPAGTWHPGFAWAWRVPSLNKVGGLIEHGILGAGDNHMARALVGRADESLNPKLTDGYKRRVLTWQSLAEQRIKRNIGYVDGTLIHHWHGRIANRRYLDRWKLLITHQFDPDYDLTKDRNGIIELVDNKPGLRDDVRRYFRQRNEDELYVPDADHQLVAPKPDMF